MRNFFLSFFLTKQKLYTKLIIFLFLVVNTFFTLLECNGSCICCEECLYCFRNKNENEKESFVKKIFGKTKNEIVVLENGNNNNNNNNTLSQIFSFLEEKGKEYSKEKNNPLEDQDKTFTEPKTQAKIEVSKDTITKVTLKSFSFMVIALSKKSIDENSVKRDASLTSDLNKIEHFAKIYGFYNYSEHFFVCFEDISNFKYLTTYLTANKVSKQLFNKVSKQLFDILKRLRESKIVKNFPHLLPFYIDDSSETVSLKIFPMPKYSGGFKIKEKTTKNFFDSFNEYSRIALRSPQLKEHIINNNFPEDYNPFNEDLFFVGIFLYMFKNKKYPAFINSGHLRQVLKNGNYDTEEKFKETLKKDITNFYDYFNSDNYKNHEDELYNKIFLKFKDKNDNDTIEINEFINKLNP